LTGAGDAQTAHRVLVAALEEDHRTGAADTETVAEAIHTLGEICLYAAQPALWPAFDTALTRVPLQELPVLTLWSRTVADPARGAHTALVVLERALQTLDDERDPVRVERIATAALFVDRIDAARIPLMRLVRDALAGNSVGPGIVAMALLSSEDFRRGRWSRARELATQGRRIATDTGADLLAWPLRLTEAWVAAATGDHDAVEAVVDQMHAWATPRQIGTVSHYAHHAAGLDALGRGDYDTAFRQLSAVSPPGVLHGHVGHALWVAMDLVEAAVHAGRRDAAAAHVRAMRVARIGTLSDRLRLAEAGAAAMAAKPLDEALFERALATPHAAQWPFDLARIQLAYGQMLRRDSAPNAAHPQLESALMTFRRLGAQPRAERAEQELGATAKAKSRDRLRGTGTPLTSQEREVAKLAGHGMTNQQIGDRLFISPRTVGAHLERAYRKLGVSSRGGLHQALAGELDFSRTASVTSSDHA